MTEKNQPPPDVLLNQEEEDRYEAARMRALLDRFDPQLKNGRARPLLPSISQTELPNLSYRLEDLLAEVQSELFPTVEDRVNICFGKMEYLACIRVDSPNRFIQIHPTLNHPTTPRQFMRELLIHELGHITVPPRVIDGKRNFHPPEFWEEQRRLLGGGGFSDTWLKWAIGDALWDDEENQCYRVRPRAWKKAWKEGFPDWEVLQEVFGVRVVTK